MRCVEREESWFTVPPGQSCEGYAGGFLRQAGGYIRDAGGGLCAFCQYASGDQFVCLPLMPLVWWFGANV